MCSDQSASEVDAFWYSGDTDVTALLIDAESHVRLSGWEAQMLPGGHRWHSYSN